MPSAAAWLLIGAVAAVPPAATVATQDRAAPRAAPAPPAESIAACAAAAERLWQQRGYDKPRKDPPGQATTVSRASHYNRELDRCLVQITSRTVTQRAQTTATLDEVFDALAGTPVASLSIKGDVRLLGMLDAGVVMRVEATPANLAAFRNLMRK
jgi:hypothetical protein